MKELSAAALKGANRKERRIKKAMVTASNGLPTASRASRKAAIVSGNLHHVKDNVGKEAMQGYISQFAHPNAQRGLRLEYVYDLGVPYPVIVMDSSIRMDNDTVMATVKGTFSERCTPLHKRNSDMFGLGQKSFQVRLDSSTGPIIVEVVRNAFTEEESTASYLLEFLHQSKSKGWNKGCEADPRPFPERILGQLSDAKAMKSGGLMSTNVKWIKNLGSNNILKALGIRVHYSNAKGQMVDRPLSAYIDRHTWGANKCYQLCASLSSHAPEESSLALLYLSRIQDLYKRLVAPYLLSHGYPLDIIVDSLSEIMSTLTMTTLRITNYQPMGIHRDPPIPLYALLCGHTNFVWDDGRLVRANKGGNLFLADGMFRVDYGIRDAVIMDGNWAHGVSNIRGMDQNVDTHSRFSIVSHSKWCREKMKKAGNYDGYYNVESKEK